MPTPSTRISPGVAAKYHSSLVESLEYAYRQLQEHNSEYHHRTSEEFLNQTRALLDSIRAEASKPKGMKGPKVVPIGKFKT